MKIYLRRIFMVLSLLFFFLAFIPSCSIDSQLISTADALVESNIESPITTEQVQDSTKQPTTKDSIKDDISVTKLSINGKQFYINDEATYKGRYWNGHKIEGLLMNSRMVQGIFDDSNSSTKQLFVYPDTNTWNPDRNTDEFIAAMPEWKSKGLLAFTLNLQGGSPTGYGNTQPWINSAFDAQGELKLAYANRLKRILDKANELNMAVILGYFYFGQDHVLENETAVINAVDNITHWLLDKGYQNLLIEINNECNSQYDHEILQENRIHELIDRVKNIQVDDQRLLVSTSFTGGVIPTEQVIQKSDYIILHGNAVNSPNALRSFIANTRNVTGAENKPIIINEDDHYNFNQADYNLLAAIDGYTSWGFFDYRRQGENYEEGFQSVPVDWSINSNRKNSFFDKLKEVTGF